MTIDPAARHENPFGEAYGSASRQAAQVAAFPRDGLSDHRPGVGGGAGLEGPPTRRAAAGEGCHVLPNGPGRYRRRVWNAVADAGLGFDDLRVAEFAS